MYQLGRMRSAIGQEHTVVESPRLCSIKTRNVIAAYHSN